LERGFPWKPLGAVQDLARRFAREKVLPEAARLDREARFPWELFWEGAALGLPVLVVPEVYGGAGLGPRALAVVAEELAYACPGVAAALLLNNLVADALLLSGSRYAQGLPAPPEGGGGLLRPDRAPCGLGRGRHPQPGRAGSGRLPAFWAQDLDQPRP
jgi:hypothetical protein